MIASLRGMATAITADHAIIDVQGVGYLVQASSRSLGRLSSDAPAFLHIETVVREGAITLFGFAHVGERDWFRHLTTVQGVGGRLALAILSTLGPDDLARAIAAEDKAMLARANGVGPRLATRIITELKARGPALPAISDGAAIDGMASVPATSAARDAASALENLGFRPAEAAGAVGEAEKELGADAGVNDLIRIALRRATRI